MAVPGGRSRTQNRDPALQETLLVPCFRCGVCCLQNQVLMERHEALRIAENLDIDLNEFLKRYIDRRMIGANCFLLRQRSNGACIFLEHFDNGITRCLIHPFKPLSCIRWLPSLSRRECRQGLRQVWGLTSGPRGELQGAQGEIRRFRSFLDSLSRVDGMLCSYAGLPPRKELL